MITRDSGSRLMHEECHAIRNLLDASWDSYQHELGSAGGTEVGIDLDTDLMRLATGGSAA